MRLTVEDYGPIEVSSPDELERALSVLGAEGVGYATLAQADASFVAASRTGPQRFRVEHRDGWESPLFASRSETFSRAEVVALFARFLQGDGEWRSSVEWVEVDLPIGRRPAPRTRSWSPRPGSWLDRDVTGLGVILLVVLLVALSALTVGVWRHQAAFALHARHAVGTVVGNPGRPVIRFQTPDGGAVEFQSGVGSSAPRYALRQRVAVLYDPLRPSDARIDDAADVWTIPAVLGAVCAMAWTASIAGLASSLRRRARHAARRARAA